MKCAFLPRTFHGSGVNPEWRALLLLQGEEFVTVTDDDDSLSHFLIKMTCTSASAALRTTLGVL